MPRRCCESRCCLSNTFRPHSNQKPSMDAIAFRKYWTHKTFYAEIAPKVFHTPGDPADTHTQPTNPPAMGASFKKIAPRS